jgi:hypothetical protein
MEPHIRLDENTLLRLSVEIMGILNDPPSVADAIKCILTAIKQKTGFDAVGIRLKSGDDFPYFVQDGFSGDFLLTENTLLASAKGGGGCKDENGNYCLECTCGMVISGKTDPANPLFTPQGSAWTNNSLPILDIPPDQDPWLHPRNRCIHDGYSSIALVPVKAHKQIVGLLQLNNRKKDCFTLDTIHFFEGIGASVGVALMRKQAEETLEKERDNLKKALDEITTLRGIIPICAWCNKVRNDKGSWDMLERYVSDHTDAKFSHGICPECNTELLAKAKANLSLNTSTAVTGS